MTRTPLAPTLAADVDVYLVRVRYTVDGTHYWPERDDAIANRASVISDILDAQVKDVAQVVKFNTDTFSCEDVTKDIARDVLAAEINERGEVRDHLRDFLEQHLGCRAVATAEREVEMA